MPNLGGGELLIILVILLLVFGGSQLPKLAKSLGEARREFEKGNAEAEADAKSAGELPRMSAEEREAELARREADLARREAEARNQQD